MIDPKRVAPALADLPPSRWAKIVHRMEVVDRYRAIPTPSDDDVAAAAEEVELSPPRFRRLVRSLAGPHPWERRAKRGADVDPGVRELVAAVLRDHGAGASQEAVWNDVAARAETLGLTVPSRWTVVAMIVETPDQPDVAGFIRREADIVLDAAVLPIPLEEAKVPGAAWLLAAIDAASGRILASGLHRLPPQLGDVEGFIRLIPPLRWREDRFRLIHTRGIPDLNVLSPLLAASGMRLDRRSSKHIAPGRALRGTYGRWIGQMKILEMPPSAPDLSAGAVSIEVAGAVIEELVTRRNAQLPPPVAAA